LAGDLLTRKLISVFRKIGPGLGFLNELDSQHGAEFGQCLDGELENLIDQ
jgi:hypothetical protein